MVFENNRQTVVRSSENNNLCLELGLNNVLHKTTCQRITILLNI